MSDCCALCSTFSCDCGPDAPCMVELRNPKPLEIPKRADGKNPFHEPVVIDDHAEHVAAHVNLMRCLSDNLFEVRWSENFLVHWWRRFWSGPKLITGKEYFANAYMTMEKHIPDHQRLIKKNENPQT